MTDAVANAEPETKRTSKMSMAIGLLAVLLGAAAGFYLVFTGMILATDNAKPTGTVPYQLPDVAFVPVEPMVVSLHPISQGRHLRFRAELEVPSQYESDMQVLMPRVVNVMNGYLRALETQDFENPGALLRIRAQLLRRIEVIAGPDRINDLLIMEYVIN